MKKTKNVKIQFWGVGRRKKAIARVRISSGGENGIIINKKPMDEYFKTDAQKFIVKQPLELTGTADKYDVNVNVYGGGLTGQALHSAENNTDSDRTALREEAIRQILEEFLA